MRPVFYASFGALDIPGPVYSLRDDLRGRYTLDQFLPRVFAGDELITLTPGTRLLRGLAGDGPVLVARKDGEGLIISEQIEVAEPAQFEVLQRLARGPVQVSELPGESDKFLGALWLAGLLTTTSLSELVGLR